MQGGADGRQDSHSLRAFVALDCRVRAGDGAGVCARVLSLAGTLLERGRGRARPWRYVPLGEDVWITLGGDYRLRADLVSDDEFGFGPGGAFTAFSQRLYAHGDMRVGGNTRLFVQLVAADEDGREPGPRAFDQTAVDLSQAFADVALGATTVRIGRQEVTMDGNRLVTIRDAAVRRTFDGARWDAPLGDNASLLAFWYRPVFVRPGGFDDRSGEREEFSGADLEFALNAQSELHLFAFDRRRDRGVWAAVSGVEERHSYGARWVWRNERYDAAAQAAYQDGAIDAQSIEAGGATFDAGMRLHGAWAPRLGVSMSYASGDRRRDDDELNTFDPHYPIISVLTEAPIYFPANLSHAGLNLTLAPLQDLSVRIEALHFARSSDDDAIYSSIGAVLVATPDGARASSNALVANAVWAPSRYFDAQIQLAFASPLGALERAGAANVSYGLFQVSAHF